MTKRFGRNQRRKMREDIEALQKRLTVAQAEREHMKESRDRLAGEFQSWQNAVAVIERPGGRQNITRRDVMDQITARRNAIALGHAPAPIGRFEPQVSRVGIGYRNDPEDI